MKRNVLAAAAGVVLLGVAIVGGAAVAGAQAKKALHEAPLAWQAQWPLMKVVSQRYERGLFSSTNTIVLQFGCHGAPDGNGQVTFRQRIQHGPLPGFTGVGAAVIDTELVVPESERQQVAALIGNQSPLSAHTVVGLTGTTTTQFAIPAMNYKAPTGGQMVWQGLSGEVRQSGSGLHYEISSPGFNVVSQDDKMALELTLGALRMRGDLTGTAGSLWLRPGTGSLELASFDVKTSAAAERGMPAVAMSFKQLKATAENKLEQDLLSNVSTFSASGVFNEVKVDKVEMLASVKRLHAPTYQRLLQRVMDTGSAACELKQSVSPQVMLADLQKDFAALLPFNPEYAIDKLALDLDGKHGELSYAFGIHGATGEDAKQPLPMLLMSKMQVRGQARLPAAWVESAMARFGNGVQASQADPAGQAEVASLMLTKLTNDGLIVRDGDMVSSQFSYDRGQMLVNGKPVGRAPAQ